MGFLEMKGALKEIMCRTQVTLYTLKKSYISDFSYKICERHYLVEITMILESQSWYLNPALIYSL